MKKRYLLGAGLAVAALAACASAAPGASTTSTSSASIASPTASEENGMVVPFRVIAVEALAVRTTSAPEAE